MSKKNGSRTAPKAPETKKDETEADEFPLDENSALAIQLGQSRLNEANLAVQLRQREMETTLTAVRTKYEEGGRYTVTSVNFQKMVVIRTPVEQRKDEPAPPAPNSVTH